MTSQTVSFFVSTFSSNRKYLGFLGLVVAVALPFVVERFVLYIIITMLMFSVLTTTLDLLVGYTGYLNLAHATFFGLGGYVVGRLVVDFGLPFLVALVAAILVVVALGLLIGLSTARVGGVYFAIVTFALAIIFEYMARSLTEVTGGAAGVPGVPNVAFFGVEVQSFPGYYLLFLGLLMGTLYIKHLLVSSRAGRAMKAIREDEELAKSVGIDTTRHKVFAVVVSSTMAGVAGTFWVSFTHFVGPATGGFFRSFMIFVMVVVGGSGTFVGPIVGAFLVTYIRDVISPVSAQFTHLLFGTFLLVTIIWMPEGIYPRLKSKISGYLTRHERETEETTVADDGDATAGGETN